MLRTGVRCFALPSGALPRPIVTIGCVMSLAPPERRAELMSGYSDWIDIGSAIGPPTAFMHAERVGLFSSYGCTAVLMLAVAGWFVVAWRRA